jgi:anti-sigma28 factor (negative regulator of flagellin synthesis)
MIWFSQLVLQEQERPIPAYGYQGSKEKQVKRIRAAIEAGENLGFLPGI